MKSFQVRISDELDKAIQEIADDQQCTKVHEIRQAIHFRIQLERLVQRGGKLFVEDLKTGEKTELIILGLTRPR